MARGNPRISPLFLLVIITVATDATAFDTRAFDIPNSEMDRGKQGPPNGRPRK